MGALARSTSAIAIGLCTLATACTAIVAAQLADTDELPKAEAGASSSSGSSSGSSGFGECSLIDRADGGNECVSCIEDNCADDLANACTPDGGAESWFDTVQRCARFPVYGPDPYSWPCSSYDKDAGFISGDSPAARERNLEICVSNNCVKGTLPACKHCLVSVRDTAGEEHFLEGEDRCGKCIYDSCRETLVRCCKRTVINANVKYCAFTDDSDFKEKCLELREDHPDGSTRADLVQQNDVDGVCEWDMRECVRTKCQGSCN